MRLLTKAGFGLLLLFVSLAISPTAKADPFVIQTGGFELHNLGNNGTVANGLDALIGTASSSSHTLNGPGSFVATLNNPLTFIEGFTGTGSEGSFNFNFSQALSINGQTQMLDLVGRIDIGTFADSVHILSAAPLTFDFNTFSVAVTVLPADIFGPGDGVFCDILKAEFTVTNNCNPVPEPATLTLLGLGLAGGAAKLRRRRRLRRS